MPISNTPYYGTKNRIFSYLKGFTPTGNWRCACNANEQDIKADRSGEVFFDNGIQEIDPYLYDHEFCAGCGSLAVNGAMYCYLRSDRPLLLTNTAVIGKPFSSSFLSSVAAICTISGGACPQCSSDVYYVNFPKIVLDSNGKDIFQKRYVCFRGGHILNKNSGTLVYEGVGRLYGLVPNIQNGTKNSKCECGAAATGAPPHSPVHSRWCPEFDDTPPKHAETQEELVARVRAARKGAAVTP